MVAWTGDARCVGCARERRAAGEGGGYCCNASLAVAGATYCFLGPTARLYTVWQGGFPASGWYGSVKATRTLARGYNLLRYDFLTRRTYYLITLTATQMRGIPWRNVFARPSPSKGVRKALLAAHWRPECMNPRPTLAHCPRWQPPGRSQPCRG